MNRFVLCVLKQFTSKPRYASLHKDQRYSYWTKLKGKASMLATVIPIITFIFPHPSVLRHYLQGLSRHPCHCTLCLLQSAFLGAAGLRYSVVHEPSGPSRSTGCLSTTTAHPLWNVPSACRGANLQISTSWVTTHAHPNSLLTHRASLPHFFRGEPTSKL